MTWERAHKWQINWNLFMERTAERSNNRRILRRKETIFLTHSPVTMGWRQYGCRNLGETNNKAFESESETCEPYRKRTSTYNVSLTFSCPQ